MHVVDVNFTVPNGGESISNIDTGIPDGFNLRSRQHHACFKRVFNEVVMGSFLVLGQNFPVTFLTHVLTPSNVLRIP
ncbi:hypothetical protein D3C85_1426240 [compost metagenome]